MSQHRREKYWVWRASKGSLREAVVAAVDRIEALEVALSNYTGGSHCNPARIALGLEPFRNGFALPLEDGVIK